MLLSGKKLTFAKIFALIGNFLPRVEREIGRLIDCLSGDLSVIFVIERQHTAEQQVDDDTQTPKIDLFSIRLLEQNFRGHIGL